MSFSVDNIRQFELQIKETLDIMAVRTNVSLIDKNTLHNLYQQVIIAGQKLIDHTNDENMVDYVAIVEQINILMTTINTEISNNVLNLTDTMVYRDKDNNLLAYSPLNKLYMY